MTRSIFYGFSSYVGSTTGPTTCTWWPGDPATFNWDPNKEIPNDLSQNPTAVRNGIITPAQIQVDDFTGGGGQNKIGPTWPGGAMIGGCWLESVHWTNLAAGIKPPRVPKGMPCHDYELCSVLYWDGPMTNRRFYGFYASIIAESGPSAQCQIWAAGTSLTPGQPPQLTTWLNLTTTCHPIEAGFTTIGVGLNPKLGALFIDAPNVSTLGLHIAKLPPSLGLCHLVLSEK